ncbi:DNA alkylation repair protein [candidate division KSB1 bacterium]|nr:DNA alkylation repair protein [candidate division KSB1 bacterium]
MDFEDIMQELKSLGTEQNRKVYTKHGVIDNFFGVSFKHLRNLAQKIKANHQLARELWATGNHDARNLATMIADPQIITETELEKWANDLKDYILADSFAQFVSKTQFHRLKMASWTPSENEWIGRTGWQLLALLAMNDRALPDNYFENYLKIIEHKIHTSKNRTRYAMNAALIAIGIRNPELKLKALESARKIGKVAVDHGDTSCKTPIASEYIEKTWKHRKK